MEIIDAGFVGVTLTEDTKLLQKSFIQQFMHWNDFVESLRKKDRFVFLLICTDILERKTSSCMETTNKVIGLVLESSLSSWANFLIILATITHDSITQSTKNPQLEFHYSKNLKFQMSLQWKQAF